MSDSICIFVGEIFRNSPRWLITTPGEEMNKPIPLVRIPRGGALPPPPQPPPRVELPAMVKGKIIPVGASKARADQQVPKASEMRRRVVLSERHLVVTSRKTLHGLPRRPPHGRLQEELQLRVCQSKSQKFHRKGRRPRQKKFLPRTQTSRHQKS